MQSFTFEVLVEIFVPRYLDGCDGCEISLVASIRVARGGTDNNKSERRKHENFLG